MSMLFNNVRIRKPRRNLFDLSHEKKLSMNMGDLVPIFLKSTVPGDKFRVSSEMLIRMAPMIAPMMHRVNAYIHYFFVPMRLLWDNWETFITGGKDGLAAPTFPTMTVNDSYKAKYQKGMLPDYMGIPVTSGLVTINNTLKYNALPFRAYQLIFDNYYKDQTLGISPNITKNDTVDATEHASLTLLRKRAWEKDYFTSALPFVQRGADVVLPNDPVYKDISQVYDDNTDTLAGAGQLTSASDGGLAHSVTGDARIENIDGIDITINELRRSVKLQEWLEKNARGGYRYIEQILSHFGVRSSDARLQRPEYLGGGRTPVVISEVLNTSDTSTRPQADMAGHGIGVGKSNQFSKYFEEHGYILGIMSILPRTAYQQGVPKEFLKTDKFDYYWPEFANLGEQEILNKELYHDYYGTPAYPNDDVFGYQSRYAEYKFEHSTVHGDFKDNLSFWHMGRIFTDTPALNDTFIKADPTHRVFAVTNPDIHKVYVQIYNDVKAVRPMPVFGSPML